MVRGMQIGGVGGRCGAVLVAGALVALAALAATAGRGSTTALLSAAALTALVAWSATLVLVRRLAAARELALRDALTGLPNRVLLDDRIEQAIARAARTDERFAVLEIDLDGFKEVNDVRGHEAGDQVLVATAARLEDIVRGSDTVARVGGDEFVVLSLGTSTEEEAAALVQRIRAELRLPFVVSDGIAEIDASVGVALFPDHGATPVELLGRADGEMFRSKRQGTAPDATPRRGSLDGGIVREVETALGNGELVVHFQPVVDLDTGTVVAAEALVRRLHPVRGIVTPAEFLPHVERTSVIRELTLHVLGETFRELARWQRLGHRLDAYVNVPVRMADDPVLREGLVGLAEAHGVSASRITLEMAGFSAKALLDLDPGALRALRETGVRLALDDFGRGDSIAALRALPVDEVKVDASFVEGTGPAAEAVLASLVRLAHDLELAVTAEGVESAGAYGALRRLGCDRAQGYLVQRPLDADGLAAWLERPRAALAS